MLDLSQYESLGAALHAAMERWPDEICLIEADREQERCRLTLSPVSRCRAGHRGGPPRKWIWRGGSRRHSHEQSIQMADCGLRDFLLWRRAGAAGLQAERGGARSAGGALEGARADRGISDLAGAQPNRSLGDAGGNRCGDRSSCQCGTGARDSMGGVPQRKEGGVSAAQTPRSGVHRLFLRHGRTSEGLRADARKLSGAVRGSRAALAVLAGRALPQHHPHQPRHRLHGRLHHAVYGRRHGGAFAHLAAGIHSRSVYAIQDHLHGGGAADPEESGARLARAVCGFAARQSGAC